MHEDESGIDNGAYGLRLRPIDMQKLGILYLQQGVWEKKRLLSSDWVLRSFSPWLKTTSGAGEPNYGWYWWTIDYGSGMTTVRPTRSRRWVARVSTGWKGQRIAVFADQGLVVTMTGLVEPPEDEAAIFRRVVRDYVAPSIEGTGAEAAHPDPGLREPMAEALARVRSEPPPLKHEIEPRMVPSVAPKETHHPFRRN